MQNFCWCCQRPQFNPACFAYYLLSNSRGGFLNRKHQLSFREQNCVKVKLRRLFNVNIRLEDSLCFCFVSEDHSFFLQICSCKREEPTITSLNFRHSLVFLAKYCQSLSQPRTSLFASSLARSRLREISEVSTIGEIDVVPLELCLHIYACCVLVYRSNFLNTPCLVVAQLLPLVVVVQNLRSFNLTYPVRFLGY